MRQQLVRSSEGGEAVDGLPSVEVVGSLPVEAIPEVLGKLRRVEVELWRRLLVEHASQRAPAADEPLQVTVEEVAKLLAYPVSYVRELTRNGELPCVRRGKYVRVAVTDVHAWVQRHRDREVDPSRSLLYRGGEGSLRVRRRANPSEAN